MGTAPAPGISWSFFARTPGPTATGLKNSLKTPGSIPCQILTRLAGRTIRDEFLPKGDDTDKRNFPEP